MMKPLITYMFSCSIFLLFGQQHLNEIDTSLDYQERFYQNGRLITTNTILYIDSVNTYTVHQIQSDPAIDTTVLHRVQDGLWIEYFDKKWNASDPPHHSYFRLGEYDLGYTTGKIYYFNKQCELIESALRYPIVNDTVFEGVRKITYSKGKITWIKYQRFLEDSLKEPYVNLSNYYPNGQLKSYNLSDDFNYKYHTQKYNKNGLCTHELKLNRHESYTIKRKGRKEMCLIKENGVPIRLTKIDGVEVKRRNNQSH